MSSAKDHRLEGEADFDESWDDQITSSQGESLVHLRLGKRVYILHQDTGPGAPRDHFLAAGDTIVGRSLEADIQIEAADISRRHLLLRSEGEVFTCRDLDSRNGVHLNGTRIASATLQDGDVLQLGSVIFFFRETR